MIEKEYVQGIVAEGMSRVEEYHGKCSLWPPSGHWASLYNPRFV